MLTQAQIQHAVRANPVHAHALGWEKKLVSVAEFLGVPGAAADAPRLAEQAERFQRGHPPLEKDGVIGPETWKLLNPALDTLTQLPSDPEAPPPKTSHPTAAQVKYLDDWLLSYTADHARAVDPWTFYEKVDAYLGPFGEEGYPLGYGKKYCKLFNGDSMLQKNVQARAWVHRTTILLQTYLREFVVARYKAGTLPTLTEAELRKAAFAQHPRAYTQGGLTLVLFLAPHLVPVIASIPGIEFVNGNAGSSWVQALETGMLVAADANRIFFFTIVGPAHNGTWARAHDQDVARFRQRQQMSEFLTDLKDAIAAGKLDRVAWLDKITAAIDGTEYPDKAMRLFAAEVRDAANARKRAIAAKYKLDIRLEPALEAQYNSYDPGWNRW